MDRREFLKASAIAAVAAAFPTAILLSPKSYFDVKFTHQYDLETNNYILTGAVYIFDVIHTHCIEQHTFSVQLRNHATEEDRSYAENMIRKALHEKFTDGLSRGLSRIGDTVRLPLAS